MPRGVNRKNHNGKIEAGAKPAKAEENPKSTEAETKIVKQKDATHSIKNSDLSRRRKRRCSFLVIGVNSTDAKQFRKRNHGWSFILVSVVITLALALAIAATASVFLNLYELEPHTFTLTAKTVTLESGLHPFDNGSSILSVEAYLAAEEQVSLNPCAIDSTGNEELTKAVARYKSGCQLSTSAADHKVVLQSPNEERPSIMKFSLLTQPIESEKEAPCPIVLQSEPGSEGRVAVSWLSTGKSDSCVFNASIRLLPENKTLVKGLELDNEEVSVFQKEDSSVDFEMPLAPMRPVRLELAERLDSGINIWFVGANAQNKQREFQTLRFMPVGPDTYTYRAGAFDIIESSCEAGAAHYVLFKAGSRGPIVLSLVQLTREGLVLSFDVQPGFEIDTGTCHLSSSTVRYKAVAISFLAIFLSLVGLLSTVFGIFDWFNKRNAG